MCSNVEWTNNEASRSKLALAELGYMQDNFVKHFCNSALRRTPEINRGYYSRVYAIAHSVRLFCLREGATAQLVNIGAGFDTLFWRLQSHADVNFARYVDVDTTEVIQHKIKAINESSDLLAVCGKVDLQSSSMFHSDRYHAISQDATKALQLVDKLVKKCKLDKTQPILFIFECVLLYWSEEARTNLLYTLNKTFERCNFVIFDLVNTNDKFSHLMQQSLSEHDTPLLGATSTRTLQDWQQNFEKSGSKYVMAWLMTEVYDQLMDKKEKTRIEKIEFLDEVELLTQLFNHYCLVKASNYTQVSW